MAKQSDKPPHTPSIITKHSKQEHVFKRLSRERIEYDRSRYTAGERERADTFVQSLALQSFVADHITLKDQALQHNRLVMDHMLDSGTADEMEAHLHSARAQYQFNDEEIRGALRLLRMAKEFEESMVKGSTGPTRT